MNFNGALPIREISVRTFQSHTRQRRDSSRVFLLLSVICEVKKKRGEKSLSINNNKHFVNVVHISLKTVLVFFFLELDLLLFFF